MEITLKELPQLPGVYFFKDKEHAIIYIGKAKALRKRISSYFQRVPEDEKIRALLAEQKSLEYIITSSELEALMLEAHLIQRYKPRYNVLMTSGNPFLYVVFTAGKRSLPEMKLVRQKTVQGTYFGPFLHKSSARAGFEYIMRTFKLRLCKKKIKNGCLDYHLGTCAGACLPTFNNEEYKVRLELAKATLQGKKRQFLHVIKEAIKGANEKHEYEKAKYLHHYALHLDHIFEAILTKFNGRHFDAEIFKVVTPTTMIENVAERGSMELQECLQLTAPPRIIDCFDVSHFQGTYLVGSCVRFQDSVPLARGFRRFKIKTISQIDDYASLREIVQRRYKQGEFPDLILIDGGKGQLNAIKELVKPVPCVALAKREERLFTPEHPEGILIKQGTDMGNLIIALRDYAHHFAISYHKILRNKGVQS